MTYFFEASRRRFSHHNRSLPGGTSPLGLPLPGFGPEPPRRIFAEIRVASDLPPITRNARLQHLPGGRVASSGKGELAQQRRHCERGARLSKEGSSGRTIGPLFERLVHNLMTRRASLCDLPLRADAIDLFLGQRACNLCVFRVVNKFKNCAKIIPKRP